MMCLSQPPHYIQQQIPLPRDTKVIANSFLVFLRRYLGVRAFLHVKLPRRQPRKVCLFCTLFLQNRLVVYSELKNCVSFGICS